MNVKRNLMLNLSTLMKKKDVSGDQLSESTGISCATISRIKQGKVNPTLDKIIPICNFFGISINELCGQKNFIEDDGIKSTILETNSIPLVEWDSFEKNGFHALQNATTKINTEFSYKDLLAINYSRAIDFLNNPVFLVMPHNTKEPSSLIILKEESTGNNLICFHKLDFSGSLIRSVHAPMKWTHLTGEFSIVANIFQIKQNF